MKCNCIAEYQGQDDLGDRIDFRTIKQKTTTKFHYVISNSQIIVDINWAYLYNTID